MKWIPRRFRNDKPAVEPGSGPVLIHALDGFLGAGSAARLASDQLRSGHGEVVHDFDIDEMFDYRARRPMIGFHEDHYAEYDQPSLQIVLEHDANQMPYLLLAGPEPDFRWERFIDEVHEVIQDLGVPLSVGLGAVPMGVPHTRPPMITAHGTRPDLVDRKNLWSAQVTVPSSAQALLEYRLGEWGHDAAGYVVHVPHYLSQMDYPTAALALLDALVDRIGLSVDVDALRARQGESLAEIEQQIEEQGGASVLGGLEEQYDAFTRGAAESLLASEDELPSGEELAVQFEQFLARQRKNDQG
ncbi:PAC2 family protein [Aeromicrobium sp.]|uniref:PAC2 family protein n=1 Tax=Aeromicrobium sp. TaxID=1871063 RepID=UPI0019BFA31B|nr:PAC2 family protein [Aeromicrobium sp.]MBC7633248.1 PAC2 family protein [Aeromicrobium sp.]